MSIQLKGRTYADMVVNLPECLDFYEDARRDIVRGLLEKFGKKYGVPEVGRNRACYISKHCVIKVPLNEGGIGDNDWGGRVSDLEGRD